MTTYESWKAEAMRLAWRCEEVAISEFKSIASEEELSAARAALEAHLEALPMGEPVATLHTEAEGIGTWAEIPQPILATLEVGDLPLYSHPKESA